MLPSDLSDVPYPAFRSGFVLIVGVGKFMKDMDRLKLFPGEITIKM